MVEEAMEYPAELREELMLDPSLLLYPAGFDEVSTVLREEPSHRIWIPERFYRAVVDDESLDSFWREYDLPRETTPFAQIQSLFEVNGTIQPFPPAGVEPFHETQLQRRFQGGLRLVAGGSDFLADLWYQEWVFLNSRSWIASTSKRAFDAFKSAGAIAVELPQAFDTVVRRTPGVVPAGPHAALTATQRLRAVAKWFAAGGAGWATALNPILGLAFGSAAGIFLLFDP